jgi:hypothetical protein
MVNERIDIANKPKVQKCAKCGIPRGEYGVKGKCWTNWGLCHPCAKIEYPREYRNAGDWLREPCVCPHCHKEHLSEYQRYKVKKYGDVDELRARIEQLEAEAGKKKVPMSQEEQNKHDVLEEQSRVQAHTGDYYVTAAPGTKGSKITQKPPEVKVLVKSDNVLGRTEAPPTRQESDDALEEYKEGVDNDVSDVDVPEIDEKIVKLLRADSPRLKKPQNEVS